jgi:hypothetical protein
VRHPAGHGNAGPRPGLRGGDRRSDPERGTAQAVATADNAATIVALTAGWRGAVVLVSGSVAAWRSAAVAPFVAMVLTLTEYPDASR